MTCFSVTSIEITIEIKGFSRKKVKLFLFKSGWTTEFGIKMGFWHLTFGTFPKVVGGVRGWDPLPLLAGLRRALLAIFGPLEKGVQNPKITLFSTLFGDFWSYWVDGV
jgi:hypothetical protein